MALAQIISRVAMIFYLAALARHVGTEGVGQISTGTAINAMLLLLIGPGLTILLIREVAADHERVHKYISSALLLRALLIVPFIGMAALLAHLNGYPQETITIIYLYSAVYAMDTLGEVLISAFRAYERMEFEAGLQIIRDFINIGLSLLVIAAGGSLLAVVFISVVAQLVKLALTIYFLLRHVVKLRLEFDLSFSKQLLFASLPFGVLLIIQTLQAEFGTYVLSVNRSAEEVGIYAAANTVIIMLLYVPNAFAAAIYPNFAKLHKQSKQQLAHFYHVCYKYLLVLSFPLAVGTLLVGPRAIELVYGEAFAASTPVVRVMAIFLFTVVGFANGAFLYATEQQRFYAWTQGLAAIINAVLALVLIPVYGPIGAAIAFTASGLLTFAVHSIRCHRWLDLPMPLGLMARLLVASLVMGVGLMGAIEIGLPWLLAAVLVAPAIYLAALFLLNIVSRDELRVLGGAPIETGAHPNLPLETAHDAQPS